MPRIALPTQQVGIEAPRLSLIHTPTESTDSRLLMQGVTAVADKLHQQQAAVQRTQRLTDFVNASSRLDQSLNEARQQSKTGTDYTLAVPAILRQHRDAFFNHHLAMSEQEKAQYQLRWAQLGAQTETDAINWGQQQAQNMALTTLQDTDAVISANLLHNPTGSDAQRQTWQQAVENSPLPPDMKASLAAGAKSLDVCAGAVGGQ